MNRILLGAYRHNWLLGVIETLQDQFWHIWHFASWKLKAYGRHQPTLFNKWPQLRSASFGLLLSQSALRVLFAMGREAQLPAEFVVVVVVIVVVGAAVTGSRCAALALVGWGGVLSSAKKRSFVLVFASGSLRGTAGRGRGEGGSRYLNNIYTKYITQRGNKYIKKLETWGRESAAEGVPRPRMEWAATRKSTSTEGRPAITASKTFQMNCIRTHGWTYRQPYTQATTITITTNATTTTIVTTTRGTPAGGTG